MKGLSVAKQALNSIAATTTRTTIPQLPAAINFRISQSLSRNPCAKPLRKPASVLSTAAVRMPTTSKRCSNIHKTCEHNHVLAITNDTAACWVESALSCTPTPHWRILWANNAKVIVSICSSNTHNYYCCKLAAAAPYYSFDSYLILVLMLILSHPLRFLRYNQLETVYKGYYQIL
jgi:hypothetical protein